VTQFKLTHGRPPKHLGIFIFRGILSSGDSPRASRGAGMVRLRGCRVCHVEMQNITLAGGGVVWFCAACDTMGDERHIAGGGRCWPAGMARKPLKLVVDRPKADVMKKISVSGKKSLTA
jgi:hypothetical protein